MTTVLAIDTSSKHPSISVLKDNEIVSSYSFISKNDLSSTLIPSIEMVLNNLDISFKDVDVVGITRGPGIFTGIRVGLATIKGLMFDCSKPVVPMYSTTLTALKCSATHKKVIPLIDARRDEVYTAVVDTDNPWPESEPCLINISDLHKIIPQEEELCFTGSGAEYHREFLQENFSNCKFVNQSQWLSDTVAEMTARLYSEGHYTINPADIEPCYIRKPDAEVNYKK